MRVDFCSQRDRAVPHQIFCYVDTHSRSFQICTGSVIGLLKQEKKCGKLEEKAGEHENGNNNSQVPILWKQRGIVIWKKYYWRTEVFVSKQGMRL